MNTISNASGQFRHPSDEYGWQDFVITIIVAALGAAVVFATNSIPGLYGPHVGLVLSFVALMWLGFGFAHMPARWWGDLIIVGATLWSFFSAVQSKFQADWVIAAPSTCVAAVSLFLGFSEGVKRLNEWEKQRIEEGKNDIIGTLILSIFGALVLCGSARVPYAGILLAAALAFYLGAGLGCVELPIWGQVTVAALSLTGMFLGFKWQLEPVSFAISGAALGTFIGLCVFLFGFIRGVQRAKREDERDRSASSEDDFGF
ncbi:MAG: hypothetical protein UX89_C0002G0018 [Parcubacteria group bacterium GW2011_GWA2_47_16]|nr:MAG: hypothetical protein UX89_C0002G0018 [Parcubacteria group bacterium GW2011_GWA2_47_16]